MRHLQLHLISAVVVALAAGSVTGCATAPKTASDKASLEARADSTLRMMRSRDPGLADLLSASAGYVVFPEIGKGGFVVGAAYGRGILFERGRRTGFVELNQGSVGAQIGGQTFAELIVFQNSYDIQKLKVGTFQLGANASAVALTAGAAASADFQGGTEVFVLPRGGMMAELSVTGQQLNYAPPGG